MVIFNQRPDLTRDLRALPPHHEALSHRPTHIISNQHTLSRSSLSSLHSRLSQRPKTSHELCSEKGKRQNIPIQILPLPIQHLFRDGLHFLTWWGPARRRIASLPPPCACSSSSLAGAGNRGWRSEGGSPRGWHEAAHWARDAVPYTLPLVTSVAHKARNL